MRESFLTEKLGQTDAYGVTDIEYLTGEKIKIPRSGPVDVRTIDPKKLLNYEPVDAKELFSRETPEKLKESS